jgi:hypothetical protein
MLVMIKIMLLAVSLNCVLNARLWNLDGAYSHKLFSYCVFIMCVGHGNKDTMFFDINWRKVSNQAEKSHFLGIYWKAYMY